MAELLDIMIHAYSDVHLSEKDVYQTEDIP